MNATPRTAVLLGAGASRDAGLPLTERLAELLVSSFDEELATADQYQRGEQLPVVRALHVVYGAMVSHATEQGSSPLAAVNVERLVSAVRLLRDRRSHEAAPFVSAWRASIEEVDDHPLPLRDTELHIGFDRDLRLRLDGLTQDIATVARAVVAAGDGSTFRDLEDQLLRRICGLLDSPEDVSYFQPLLDLARVQPGGLDITTLNYDRTVEIAAAAQAVPVDIGLDRWVPGQPLEFAPTDGQINLIKPHGSIDWVRLSGTSHERIEGHPLVRHRYRAHTKPSPVASYRTSDTPLIVIGDREKLETDGPTLPLMRAFEESLTRAGRLVVVGYSFGDEHVNTVVRNWLVADATRTIVILDPGWSEPQRRIIGPDSELTLREALAFTAGLSLERAPGRVLVVRKGAREGLAEALASAPLGQTAEVLEIRTVLDVPSHLRVTNNGYDIEQLRISAPRMTNSAAYQSVGGLRLDPATSGGQEVTVESLPHGSSVSVYFDHLPEGEGVARVQFAGRTWAYDLHFSKEIKIPRSA
ncbi:SIR2 family protein [Microbacterium sp. NPDC057407]|uniref:SIR2 family protein n=1 Tax=Microbacterium sp. NPDC057407 TaxID=3346120 RepID=UPI00366D6AB3